MRIRSANIKNLIVSGKRFPTESDENIAKLSGNFGGARWNDDIITGLLK